MTSAVDERCSRGGQEGGGQSAMRYFSLARYAMLEALRLAGIGPGKRVLLPSFICRDLLAPIFISGGDVVWYDVDSSLNPAASSTTWPDADAVLAVNYFGFAQELSPFRAFSERTGAVVIEDNAHGYLSSDPAGNLLGTRAPLGLFSLRKTVRIPDGAALSVNDMALISGLSPQLPFVGHGAIRAQAVKSLLRGLPLIGEVLFRGMTALVRLIRKWRTGSDSPGADPESEKMIPFEPEPWRSLHEVLERFDASVEISRRRTLYAECERIGAQVGVQSVFSSLPDYCVPYGYPFRSDKKGVMEMRKFATSLGLDLITWPDLPSDEMSAVPDHYQNVYLLNFLW